MLDCGRGSRFSAGYTDFNAFLQPGRCDTGENAAELPREEDHRDDAAGGEMPNEGEGHDTRIGERAKSASSSESDAKERRDSAGVNILLLRRPMDTGCCSTDTPRPSTTSFLAPPGSWPVAGWSPRRTASPMWPASGMMLQFADVARMRSFSVCFA